VLIGGPLGSASLRESLKSITLVANNTTASMTLFTVTGTVLVHAIIGEVTTLIGSNHTAGHLRTNDQTATLDITLATGITLSALAVGTVVYKESLTAVALKLLDNAAAKFEEPAAAGTIAHSPFIVQKKATAVTTIDYRYTTTNTPTTGAILWRAIWERITQDGNLATA